MGAVEGLLPELLRIVNIDYVNSWLPKIKDAGVKISPHGLILARPRDSSVLEKIVPNLVQARRRIKEKLEEGKHVLCLPGSFDLSHIGHASYPLQCIETYLKTKKIHRDDIFITLFADEDGLITTIKEQLNGYSRPFQRGNGTNYHPRLLDLASLPYVDLVGMIPSPSTCGYLLNDSSFKEWLNRNGKIGNNHHSDKGVLEIISKYNQLVELIREGKFPSIQESFQRAEKHQGYEPQQEIWSVEAWQLLNHNFLGAEFKEDNYYRMISKGDDSQYKKIVTNLTEISGSKYFFVGDQKLVHTTDLVNAFGPEILLEEKRSVYR